MYAVEKTPTVGAVMRFISFELNQVRKPKVFLYEEGYFLVKFESISDRNEILYSGPYTMDSRPGITKALTPNFSFHDVITRVVPL